MKKLLSQKQFNRQLGMLKANASLNSISELTYFSVSKLLADNNTNPLNRLVSGLEVIKSGYLSLFKQYIQGANLPLVWQKEGRYQFKTKKEALEMPQSFASYVASEESKKLDSAIKAELTKTDLAAAKKAVAAAELSGDEAALEAANNRLNHLQKQVIKKVSVNAMLGQLTRALASQKAHGLEGTSQALAQLADLAATLAAAAKIAASTQQGIEAEAADGEAVHRLAKSGSSKKNARVS